MPMTTFSRAACLQRNRLAARRDGVNGAPVRLFRSAPDEVASERLITSVYGSAVPMEDPDEALRLINALRPGAEPLTAEQVYLHYAEAANTNFVEDRYLFLDRSTLRNIAKCGSMGVAFMNSHRTGGMSHPSELPFGRTFAGRYEEYTDAGGQLAARALVGVYLLRGLKPNGDQGPSTDDLHQLIDGGTLFDVSVGLYGGEAICDVCGNDLDEYDQRGGYVCPHVPGTNYSMSAAEIATQKARGVGDGKASYSLCNSSMGEVSAVYDGAVPGAGFRKALSFAREGRFSSADLISCRHAYHTLLARDEFSEATGGFAVPEQLAEALLSQDGPVRTIMVESTVPPGIVAGEIQLSPLSPGAAPTAVSFTEQCDAALTAVQGCLTRGAEIVALRQSQDRPQWLSPERRRQFEALQARLGSFLEETRPPEDPSRLRALRLQALKNRAAVLPRS